MYFPAHERSQRLVNHPVTRLEGLPRETPGDDRQPVVAAAAFRAFVTCVPRRFVFDGNRFGLERGELLADEILDAQARSFLSCTCLASITACSSTKASMRPMPPKSLKFTHACSE